MGKIVSSAEEEEMKTYFCGIMAATAVITPFMLHAQETVSLTGASVEEQILTAKEQKRLAKEQAFEEQKNSADTRFRKKAIERAEERARKEQQKLEERQEKSSRFQKKAIEKDIRAVQEQKDEAVVEKENLTRFQKKAQERADKRARKIQEKIERRKSRRNR